MNSTWNLFDINCRVGRHVRWQPPQLETAAELLDDMDHYGIAEAMVLDCISREAHPELGNRRVLEVCKDEPRLHPAWVAMPHAGIGEQPEPAAFLNLMREHRVGAVYLFPTEYQFSLADWCVDHLLEPLEAAGVPVVINPVQIGRPGSGTSDGTDWDAVVALCRRWPKLPVVISETRIRRSQRKLYRAFDACPNLRLELSCYWLHRGIEYLVENWGAERLLFGSNWPQFGPHMTVATLTTAEIDEPAKRAIAGDNWRQLIAWCSPKHPKVTFPEPDDAFHAYARSGEKPADMWFHDCHGHLGIHSNHYHVPEGATDQMVREMDRLGVQLTCVFSLSGVFSDERPGNDLVAEACAAHPDRFVGFTLVNPHRGPEEMRRELERGAAMGLRGVKLIPTYQHYPEEGPNIDVACQWAHENRQLILNHYWGGLPQMERLVRTYPDAGFLTGHTTTAYADIMRRYANLHVCSCPLLPPRACEDVVAAIGADRFLFGSDLTDLPIAWGTGPILFARIPAAEKALILGGNLRRLLETYSLRA